MSGLGDKLLARCSRAAAAMGGVRVARALLVSPEPSPERDAEFGLLVLEDGSAGQYYAWLGGEQAELPARFTSTELEGRDVLEVAALYRVPSDSARSLAVAAINALTTAFFRHAGWRPDDAPDSLAGLELEAGDCLGMVGNFPPLVRHARRLGVPVRIVERKTHMLGSTDDVVISLDPNVLAPCNKIICTGATLLNDSLEDMLGYCRHAASVALVGPSVGFFPDDCFELGVACVAGTEILDGERAFTALSGGERLGAAGRRTLIRQSDYPGFDVLLQRVHSAGSPATTA